jgi:predicted nucleic acid-binding protein
MLLDTTFFIDLAEEMQTRQPGPCVSFLLANRHHPKHVSVVSIGEYAVGATAAETKRFFRGFQPLALGKELAIFAGRLQNSLSFEMGENDLWIAATALRGRMPVVSRDAAFRRVAGLRVLGY